MPQRTHRILERIVIAAMLLGIVGMFQPWVIELYTWGFHLVFFGTLAFIVISHWPVRDADNA
jgi:hypothetical protein